MLPNSKKFSHLLFVIEPKTSRVSWITDYSGVFLWHFLTNKKKLENIVVCILDSILISWVTAANFSGFLQNSCCKNHASFALSEILWKGISLWCHKILRAGVTTETPTPVGFFHSNCTWHLIERAACCLIRCILEHLIRRHQEKKKRKKTHEQTSFSLFSYG